MSFWRYRLLGLVWQVTQWVARWRRPRPNGADYDRHVYPDQTRRMGVTLTEFLRKRLRGDGWRR